MITFVAPFVSQEVAEAEARARREIKRRIGPVADRVSQRRIRREYLAAHPLPRATIGQVADHVEHARRIAGSDHIGIGGDYDGNDEWPVGLEDTSRYPHLFAELVRRGWRDRDLAKLARGNIVRALREAEAVAARLRRRRPPSNARIDELDGPPGR
jgi:membrane dipeptidase